MSKVGRVTPCAPAVQVGRVTPCAPRKPGDRPFWCGGELGMSRRALEPDLKENEGNPGPVHASKVGRVTPCAPRRYFFMGSVPFANLRNEALTRIAVPRGWPPGTFQEWAVPRHFWCGMKGDKYGYPYTLKNFVMNDKSGLVYARVRFQGEKKYTLLWIGDRYSFFPRPETTH